MCLFINCLVGCYIWLFNLFRDWMHVFKSSKSWFMNIVYILNMDWDWQWGKRIAGRDRVGVSPWDSHGAFWFPFEDTPNDHTPFWVNRVDLSEWVSVVFDLSGVVDEEMYIFWHLLFEREETEVCPISLNALYSDTTAAEKPAFAFAFAWICMIDFPNIRKQSSLFDLLSSICWICC